MPEIKIVLVEDCYSDQYGDDSSSRIIREGITDWETVSDDDLALLRANLFRLAEKFHHRGLPVIIVKDAVPALQRIDSIRTWIAEERAKQQEQEDRRRAAEAEKTKKKLLKKAQTELALLAELKAKYPDAERE